MNHQPSAWLTVDEVANVLHVGRAWAWRLVRPYRSRCHLARRGRHPRLHLWVPRSVVDLLLEERGTVVVVEAETLSSPLLR